MALADTAKLVASLELEDKFSGTARKAEAGIGRLEGRISKLGSTASRGLGTLVSNLTKVAAIGAGGVAVGLAASVNAASDLNEEIDKSKVVFGEAADGLFRFADGAAAIGLSKAEALGAAGAFGNMFNTIGFAQDESADMSKTMVELAADMASFNNEDPTDMLDRLRSGLAGEAEPLRRFGVLLSEAEVKAFAYANGIAKSGDALTEAQKVQARYGLILQSTEIQQGNFADTSDSLANQQRQLSANLRNTGATIGQALLPSVAKLAKAINSLFIDKQPQIEKFGKRIGQALESVFTNKNLDKGMAAVGDFIDKLAKGGGDGEGLKTVASSVGDIAGHIAGLPWKAIADAAKLLGTGSKALLDAFLGLPPWVQTAVLTGWGLNKLTGGAVGSIVGELSKGLIKGVLGMTAGVVNINAATVNGPGGGIPGGGAAGGIGSTLARTGALASIPLAGVATAMSVDFVGDAQVMAKNILPKIDALPGKTAGDINSSIDKLNAALDVANDSQLAAIVTTATGTQDRLREERAELINTRNDLARNIVRGTDSTVRGIDRVNREVSLERSAQQAIAAADAQRINSLRDSHNAALGTLAQIRDKKSSINVTVNNSTSVSVSASLMAQRVAQINQTINSRQDINETVF